MAGGPGLRRQRLWPLGHEDLDINPTAWKLAGGKDASQLQVTTSDLAGLKNLLGMQ